MSGLNRTRVTGPHGHGGISSRRWWGWVVGVLAVLALALAACGSAATPEAMPQPTEPPASEVAAQPTAMPATTDAPAPESTAMPAPTDTPVPEPTVMPAPTDAPAPEVGVTPEVIAADQAIVEGQVTIAEVVSEGPGWLVIHAQADGKPGQVVGYVPVEDGTNSNVMVELDLTKATTSLYAMLHTDAGALGTWEFPEGPDAPVQVDDSIVMAPFELQVAEGEVEVAMVNVQFEPATLVVRAGTTVTWVNDDGAIEHNVESDTDLWHSELFPGGGSFGYTFDQQGVYPYHCHPHGDVGGVGMAGTIVVLQ